MPIHLKVLKFVPIPISIFEAEILQEVFPRKFSMHSFAPPIKSYDQPIVVP